MKGVHLLRPAEQEMIDAATYYEMQMPGLGRAFLDKVDSAVADIAAHPERWPAIRLNVRRRLIHRFPYQLFYRVEPAGVIVLAVAHLRRRPAYWIGRN